MTADHSEPAPSTVDASLDSTEAQAAATVVQGPSAVPPPAATEPRDSGPPTGGITSGILSSLALKFSPQLEDEFSTHNFEQSLTRVRGGILLGIALYAVFAVLDVWIAPEQLTTLWLIRLSVVLCAVVVFALSYRAAFRRWWQLAVMIPIAQGALGIIAMLVFIPPPGNHLYYAGLLLLTIYYATLIRLGIAYASALSALIFFSYLTVAIATGTPAIVLFNNLMMLIAGNVIALSANVALERHSRRDFWHRRLIRERALELETRNRELSSVNAELVRSRAEIARSAERNELLFAALTEALPGTVLDEKYRLEQKIGSGGFGTVYRAYHLLLRRLVAVKLLKPAAGDMVANLARFKREAITACRLTHPNAVHVFDFGVSGGSVAYLVMELLEGQSLAEELAGGRRVSLDRCSRIVEALCDVLGEAHRVGLIHRDLKPSNVFLHRSGGTEVVKVIDFGLAKVLGASGAELESVHLTMTGVLAGTPAYMPPERLLGGDGDSRSDVYALGVMVFEMLSGEKPFPADSDANWAAAIKRITDRTTPLCTKAPSIPPAIGAIVDRALARDPADRPSVQYFAHEFLKAAFPR